MSMKQPRHGGPPAGGREGVSLGFVARAGLILIAIWGLGSLIWMGRELLFVAFFAALVAAFLSIFVDRLEALGAPRSVAAMIVVVLAVGVLVGLGSLAWPTIQQQMVEIRQRLPEALAEIAAWLEVQYQAIVGELGNADPELWAQLQERVREELTGIVVGALPLLNTVVGAVAGFLIVIFAGLYLAVEPRLYVHGIASLVPPANREHVTDALHAVGSALRRWMLGTVINMVVVGTAITIGLSVLGVPAALGLGIIAALLEFIPIFGPIIATIPALAVALIVSPTLAFYVLILYVVVQQLESNVLTPLVMKGAVKLPPALTMLFQALMAVLFGFLGLLLAVPILAAAMVLTDRLYVQPLERGASRA